MNIQLFNPLRWRKSFLLLVLGGIVVIWFGFFDTYSVWKRIELNNRKETLKEKTAKLKKQTISLRKDIKHLNTDPFLLERIAREEYGMKKEGEFVYKIKVTD